MKKKHLSVLFKAYLLAERAHRGTFRKGSDEPYINHPIEVAMMIQRYAEKEYYDVNSLAAAICHDVAEDTDVTLDDIARELNDEVSDLVYFVSSVSKKSDGNRAKRKAIDLAHYKLGPAKAQTIKVADTRANIRDVVDMDPEFAKVYLPEKRAVLEALTKASPNLRAAAFIALEKAENKLLSLS